MRRPPPIRFAALLAATTSALALAAVSASAQPLPSSVVAYTGQSAPGTAGPTFFLLFTPTITRQGDVAFRGQLTGPGVNSANNSGLWREQAGPVALSLRAGDPAPLPGATWGAPFGDPNAQAIGGVARLAFSDTLVGTPSGASLWSEQPGGLRNVALIGGAAAGIPGATYALLGAARLDEAGELLFTAKVTGGGTTAADDDALFLDDGSATTLVAREGTQAPGLPPGTLFTSSFTALGAAQLAPGRVVSFLQTLLVAGVSKDGVWSTHGGALGLLAVEDGAAPGLGGNEHLGTISSLRGNRLGQISFVAAIENEFGSLVGNGLWISDATGALALALRRDSGEPGLEPLGSHLVLADNGVVYLLSTRFLSPAGSYTGVFAAAPSSWRELARQGERATDLPAGVEYASFDQLVANGNGQVGFRATLAGPGVTSANNRVLVAHGVELLFRRVARTGDALEVAPGDVRTISTLNLTQATTGGGGLRGFSDNGGLVWLAGTGGSTAAILVASLSVPPNIQLVGIEAVQVAQDWNNSVTLIESKRTYVRAHFESAPRVTVSPLLHARPAGGGPELPFSPLVASNPGGRVLTSLDAPAQRDDLLASAYWEIPPEWTFGAIEFEVELVEQELDCVEGAGPDPFDCAVDIVFQAMPTLPLRLLAIDYNLGGAPQRTTAAQRREVVARMLSAFPVNAIDWQVGSMSLPGVAATEPSTCDLMNEVALQRVLEGCAGDGACKRLYLGAIPGTVDSGCAIAGGTAGAARFLPDPRAPGRQTHSHETAHMLGRHHTVDPSLPALPNGRRQGFCGETAPASTPGFPFIHEIAGDRRPTLGPLDLGDDAVVFGLDTLLPEVVAPTEFFDLMSYCSLPGIDLWPSKDAHEFLADAIEARFAQPLFQGAGPAGAAPILLVPGSIDTEAGTGSLRTFFTLPDPPDLPALAPGPYTLRVHRSAGGPEDLAFAPEGVEGGTSAEPATFLLAVASPETVTAVELLDGATPLDSRAASANAPAVQVLSPNGGELLDGPTATLSWTASDGDLDPLLFAIQYSGDGGATWSTLATRWTGLSLEVERTRLAGSVDARLRVIASDGLRTGVDISDAAFAVEGHAPEVAITRPGSSELFFDGQALVLEATALDPEDGLLGGAALTWSSTLSGTLGSGSPLTIPVASLADGLHVVTVAAEDSDGGIATAHVQVRIDLLPLLFEDDFESGGTTLWQ